jgi:phosphoglucomutase
MEVSPLARKPPTLRFSSMFPGLPAQRVAFGTSGHRGCSLDNSFNEEHIYAIIEKA